MTILEILEAHESRLLNYACSCGAEFPPPNEHGRPYLKYRAHVAEVLDKHMQEREAKAWDRLADYAPHTSFERKRLKAENPYRKDTTNGR